MGGFTKLKLTSCSYKVVDTKTLLVCLFRARGGSLSGLARVAPCIAKGCVLVSDSAHQGLRLYRALHRGRGHNSLL